MMKILLDTSFLSALNDTKDTNYSRTVNYLQSAQDIKLYLPSPVLPELCYLLHSRLGHQAMRNFLTGLVNSDIELIPVEATDLFRVNDLLNQYTDANLDFADATLIAIAERLDISYILTFDRRDYAIIRPNHVEAFQLLP